MGPFSSQSLKMKLSCKIMYIDLQNQKSSMNNIYFLPKV